MDELAAKRGRPAGTSESIESLAKKSAQRDLKMLEIVSNGIKDDLEKVSKKLSDLAADDEAYIPLAKYRLDLKEALMKNISAAARIASSDPTRRDEGDLDASTKEILSQLKGDGV